MFKITRIIWNGKDQPIKGIYHICKPNSCRPYYQLFYHNPDRVITLQGNVKIFYSQASNACRPLTEANQMISTIKESIVDMVRNPYNYLKNKGVN